MHAHSAARGRPRRASGLSAASPAALARAVRSLVDALPEVLSTEPGQPPLRLSSAAVVRAEPSGRGLRRNLRGMADAALELAQALRGMAGTEETGICRRADGRNRREEAGRHAPAARRAAKPAHADAGRALREETRPLRDRLSEGLRPRSSPYLLRRPAPSPLADGCRISAPQSRQNQANRFEVDR